MSTALGRFKVVDQNSLSRPGKCAVCGTSSGMFLDFGFNQDFYGAIYFCFDNCFKEACNAFEYMSPSQHNIALDQIEFLRAENNQLKDQLEETQRVFRLVTSAIATDRSIPDVDIVDEESESSNTRSQDSESKSDEQINEQGSTDVQYDADLDELIRESEIDI